MPGVKASPKKSPSPSKKGKGKQRATTSPDASSPASATRSHAATDSLAPKQSVSASPMKNGRKAGKEPAREEDENELLSLAERIAESAHLLVRGRGSDQLAQQARDVVKRSFDKGARRSYPPGLRALLERLDVTSERRCLRIALLSRRAESFSLAQLSLQKPTRSRTCPPSSHPFPLPPALPPVPAPPPRSPQTNRPSPSLPRPSPNSRQTAWMPR
jgi:hypothetical protein